jgi:hypothetical protein
MPVSYRSEVPQLCPRCRSILAPGEATCYRCGLQLAPEQSWRSPQFSQSPQLPRKRQERSDQRHQAARLYFIGACLIVALFVFLMLHSAGISLSTFLPKAAAIPTRVPYPLPEGPPLFSDSFASDAYGWNLQSSPGNYTVTLGNGALTLGIEQHKLLWELLPGQRSFGNFILTVNAVLTQGDQNDGYGVYIRGASNQESDLATYYRFELYGDGSYAIFKGMPDASGNLISTKIVNYTLSSAIQKQGKLNRLMIIARGAVMSLVVNGQLVKTFSDQSYASGTVALFISNLPQAKLGAQVQFSQFAIYPV